MALLHRPSKTEKSPPPWSCLWEANSTHRSSRHLPRFHEVRRWPRAQVEQLDEEKDFDPCGLEEVRVLKLGDTLNLVVLVSLRKIEPHMGNVQKQTAFDSWVNVCVCVCVKIFCSLPWFWLSLGIPIQKGLRNAWEPFLWGCRSWCPVPFFFKRVDSRHSQPSPQVCQVMLTRVPFLLAQSRVSREVHRAHGWVLLLNSSSCFKRISQISLTRTRLGNPCAQRLNRAKHGIQVHPWYLAGSEVS